MDYFFVTTWTTSLSQHGLLLCHNMDNFFVTTWTTSLSQHGLLLCHNMDYRYFFVTTWISFLSQHDYLYYCHKTDYSFATKWFLVCHYLNYLFYNMDLPQPDYLYVKIIIFFFTPPTSFFLCLLWPRLLVFKTIIHVPGLMWTNWDSLWAHLDSFGLIETYRDTLFWLIESWNSLGLLWANWTLLRLIWPWLKIANDTCCNKNYSMFHPAWYYRILRMNLLT